MANADVEELAERGEIVRLALISVLVLAAAVTAGEVMSSAPVVPRWVSAAATCALVGGLIAVVRTSGRTLVARGRWMLSAPLVVASCLIVVASWPGIGPGLLVWGSGALFTLVAVPVGVVLTAIGPHRGKAAAATTAVAALVFAAYVAPEVPEDPGTNLRVRLLASRYRSEGAALLADPPPESDGYASPGVGVSGPDGEPEAVVWAWTEGLLGNSAGVVYAPSSRDPSYLQFGAWGALDCTLRDGRDIWWCGLT